MTKSPADSSVSPLRVLVTGAAGRLGSVVCRHLVQAGLDVLGTDQHQPRVTPGHAFVQANLLDLMAVRPLLAGRQAVVHLGNIPSAGKEPPIRTFNENTAINMNVMHSAVEAEVRSVIFASSVQAISGMRKLPDAQRLSPHPYLPLDGGIPACPSNTYGLSKQVGEITLEYFCRVQGLSGVALRLPWMADPGDIEVLRRGSYRQPRPWESLDEACAYLSYEDAARLILAILR
ncbi:MAG: NAD(P)-dependent oxidoreductase, partial [Phycisphaeraceae bacterium]|nr:NAD(P)-dependent oxidoreductase [Phycisphaeraceae bacterium]